MRKLLVIGASILQLPAIKKAKEMGLYVAVADFNPNAIGIQYADEYFNASTMDENAIFEVAQIFKPDGIMTLATDMPMRSVARVSETLGLHGISYETAVKATDKYDMINAFEDHQVPAPWFHLVRKYNDLIALKDKINYPCIMKPTDNAGSHGVVKIHSPEELVNNYEYSRACSRRGNVIIEEYLDGQEVSVEVMVVDGKVNIIQITDKLTTGAPYFVEMGHSQPSRLDQDIQNQIRDVAERACKAIGINQGPAHVEMKVTSQSGPKMIELGARMGGDNITTHLVPLSTGIDMVESTIKLALGEEINVIPTLKCASAIRYFEAPFGKIKSIENIEEALRIDGVKQISFTKNVGEESTPIHCSNDRMGFVIAQAENAEKAVELCKNAMEVIKIEIE